MVQDLPPGLLRPLRGHARAWVKPFDVTRWLDAHKGWNEAAAGSRHVPQAGVQLGGGRGHPPRQPDQEGRETRRRRRDRILTPEERLEILAAIKDEEFGDFVVRPPGDRLPPFGSRRVTASDVDLGQGVWAFEQHKTRQKTGKPRVVYLTPQMVELTRRLLEKHPDGPLFRNLRGVSGRGTPSDAGFAGSARSCHT